MRKIILCAFVFILSACSRQTVEAPVASASSLLERGRYLAEIGGCNDCHTPGYALKQGKVPESEWLTGDVVGWQGPWGTTYPRNLRIYFQGLTEEAWLQAARTMEWRPPMPWYELRKMPEEDLRAIYQFVHSMGAAGQQAPDYLPPGIEGPAPKFTFTLPEPPPVPPSPAGS